MALLPVIPGRVHLAAGAASGCVTPTAPNASPGVWKRDREWISVRDYFRVEDEDGPPLWLFRRVPAAMPDTGDMRWFLHGFF